MLNASWSAQLSSRMVLLWMSGAVDFSQRTFSIFFFLEAVSNTSVRAKNKPFSWNGCPLIWWYKSICVLDTQVIQGDKLVDIIKLWWTVTVCVAHTLFCSVLLFCSLQDARHCKNYTWWLLFLHQQTCWLLNNLTSLQISYSVGFTWIVNNNLTFCPSGKSA